MRYVALLLALAIGAAADEAPEHRDGKFFFRAEARDGSDAFEGYLPKADSVRSAFVAVRRELRERTEGGLARDGADYDVSVYWKGRWFKRPMRARKERQWDPLPGGGAIQEPVPPERGKP